MRKNRLPRFLRGTTLTAQDRIRLQPIMANWLTVHAHMSRLPVEWDSIDELNIMMLFELRYGRRLDILLRLQGRISSIRRMIEAAELMDALEAARA